MSFYPELADDFCFNLRIISDNLSENPQYLNNPECPYDGQTISDLRVLMSQAVSNDVDDAVEILEMVKAQLRELSDDLKDSKNFDDRMKFIQSALQYGERCEKALQGVYNAKTQSDFIQRVMRAFETIPDEDLRAQVLTYFEKENT